MITTAPTYDWSELAFADKKPLKGLNATFIAAPREITNKRFIELVKQYLPKGNIILGLAKEDYADGFEGQPQFRMLRDKTIRSTLKKLHTANTPHQVYVLHYFQRETPAIIDKIKPKRVIFINGSWKLSLHHTPTYYSLARQRIPFEYVSPFSSEKEARTYAVQTLFEIVSSFSVATEDLTEEAMMLLAQQTATFSFDHTFQTGVALGRQRPSHKEASYQFLATAFNKVVPFQTYAMHYGSTREQHYSPANDLNHYDTVHAEVEILISAQKQQLSLKDTALFINLMPCPACARMLVETDIQEFVYAHDHSDGYAVNMLQRAGKTVRRLVPQP